MSAAAKPMTAEKQTTLKDVTCEYCDTLIAECLCLTAHASSRYCDDCGRARPYCICMEGFCGGCDKPVAECVCGKCAKCSLRVDKCVCECSACKYPGVACRCYEGYEERDTDECPHCYSSPCECEAISRQRDLNATKDYDCPGCGEDASHCRCNAEHDDD